LGRRYVEVVALSRRMTPPVAFLVPLVSKLELASIVEMLERVVPA